MRGNRAATTARFPLDIDESSTRLLGVTDGLTPSQRLAETLLGQPLAAYLSDKRNARPVWSWRLIAEQLAADTGGAVTVSHETVRAWAVQLDAEAAA